MRDWHGEIIRIKKALIFSAVSLALLNMELTGERGQRL